MRSNKKRNFFSFSRKGGIYKAGMPKNHSIHDIRVGGSKNGSTHYLSF